MLLNVKLDLGYGDWKPENDWPGLCAVWPLAEDPQKPPRHCWDVKTGPCRMTSEEVQILVEFCTIHEFGVKLLPLPGMQIVKMKDERKWSHGETVQPVDLQSGASSPCALPMPSAAPTTFSGGASESQDHHHSLLGVADCGPDPVSYYVTWRALRMEHERTARPKIIRRVTESEIDAALRRRAEADARIRRGRIRGLIIDAIILAVLIIGMLAAAVMIGTVVAL